VFSICAADEMLAAGKREADKMESSVCCDGIPGDDVISKID
jgi:hypothetical protein